MDRGGEQSSSVPAAAAAADCIIPDIFRAARKQQIARLQSTCVHLLSRPQETSPNMRTQTRPHTHTPAAVYPTDWLCRGLRGVQAHSADAALWGDRLHPS